MMSLGASASAELVWWIENLENAHGVICRGKPDTVIETDTSGLGWGAYNGTSKIGGRWNEQEAIRAKANDINYLELWAGFLALRAFCGTKLNMTVQLKMDNTTAIAYINNMGGGVKSAQCNELAKEMWEYCVERNI